MDYMILVDVLLGLLVFSQEEMCQEPFTLEPTVGYVVVVNNMSLGISDNDNFA